MMMFWGFEVAWSQVRHQVSVSGITNRGKTRRPRAQNHRLVTYVTLRGRGQLSVTEEHLRR